MSIKALNADSTVFYLKAAQGDGSANDPIVPLYSTQFTDGANTDAFSRLRVSNPQGIFDAQLTYDLQPTLFEQITSGGGSISHDATERAALLDFTLATTGDDAVMQTFDYFPYQPGKSQQVFITFNMIEAATNVKKYARYGDASNGIEFYNDGTNNYVQIMTGTSAGNQTILQSAWNLDRLDGSGPSDDNPSGLTLDITKTQILVIDFQALYVGRVRIGFDINGIVYYVHQFENANNLVYPYIQTANLPIRCGMEASGAATTTMYYICSSVISEGGQEITSSYDFSINATGTAGNGTRTHLLSIRPKTTFNSIINRVKLLIESIDILVTGNSPVYWELVIGQALTLPSYTDVNTTYSAFEIADNETLNGSPAIVLAAGYVASTSQVKGVVRQSINTRYPITLDAEGANRDLGTLTLLITGQGATSATSAAISWREVR